MKSFALPADFCRLEGSFWIAFSRSGVAIFGVLFYGASLSFLYLFWDLFFFGSIMPSEVLDLKGLSSSSFFSDDLRHINEI